MDGPERVARLHGDWKELARRQAALGTQPSRERLAIEQLHDQIRGAVRQMAVVDHFHDIRMP